MMNINKAQNLKWLLQSDWRDEKIPKLGENACSRVIVHLSEYSENERLDIYSALIPNTYVKTALSTVEWDIFLEGGNGHPMFNRSNIHGSEKINYLRFGNSKGIEPFVIERDFDRTRNSYNEILEEFRLFHNLYYDYEKSQLLKFDERGEETVVAKIETNKVEVRLKEVLQFLAVKEMHLAIYFKLTRYSELLPNDLPIDLKYDENLTYYKFLVNSTAQSSLRNKGKSFSYLIGKKLIAPFPLERCGIWPFKQRKKYQKFIIGLDKHGESVEYTCDPYELSNGFDANQNVPSYLTSVFFRREVLQKYYANPKRYSVEDGHLRCQEFWVLKLDNNHHEYIIVFLGDLGTFLPSEEQIYWRSYNVLPDGHMSEVNLNRSFELCPAKPEQIDLVFKDCFVRFSQKWEVAKGWRFFRELAEGDQHYFQALRIPLTSSQKEFDEQVHALAKIMIDSLNEKKIFEATPGGNTEIKGGISKLDSFLKVSEYPSRQESIKFLRDLQELRSSSTAHCKGKKYQKIARKFNLKESKLSECFQKILADATDFLNELEKFFL